MIVASAACPGYVDGLGFVRNTVRRTVRATQQTPAQQKLEADVLATYARTIANPWNYTVQPPGPLTTIEKELQRIVLARDWDALFKVIPLSQWKPNWLLGKYSFAEVNGKRVYVPWTEQDIRRFVFSPHYSVQPGYACPDSQREAGVAAHWKKAQQAKAMYPPADWKHVWPITPGAGFPGQRYGCQKYRPSTWVKVRKKVYIAAAVVAAATLGPAVMSKVGSMLSGGSQAGAAGAAVGAKGGLVGTAAKAGAAGVKIGKAGQLIATTAKGAGFLGNVKAGVNLYNRANTVNAIIKGELPPPPISITGASFTEAVAGVAKDLAKKEIAGEVGERAAEYYAKKLSEKEEAILRAEIEKIQSEMAALVPAGTPTEPDPGLRPQVREKIADMQNIERDRQATAVTAALAIGIPAFLLLAG